MGCCMSYQKTIVYEVAFDESGTAHKVATGKGTHIIRVTPEQGETLERKAPVKPSDYMPKPADTFVYPALEKPSTAMQHANREPFISCFVGGREKVQAAANDKVATKTVSDGPYSINEKGAGVAETQTMAGNGPRPQRACM